MRAAVLGRPVGHSLSPLLHRAAYRALGLTDWTYDALDLGAEDVPVLLAGLGEEWRGFSVTMPWQRAPPGGPRAVGGVAPPLPAAHTPPPPPGGRRRGGQTRRPRGGAGRQPPPGCPGRPIPPPACRTAAGGPTTPTSTAWAWRCSSPASTAFPGRRSWAPAARPRPPRWRSPSSAPSTSTSSSATRPAPPTCCASSRR